jgi:hypothetical protein
MQGHYSQDCDSMAMFVVVFAIFKKAVDGNSHARTWSATARKRASLIVWR